MIVQNDYFQNLLEEIVEFVIGDNSAVEIRIFADTKTMTINCAINVSGDEQVREVELVPLPEADFKDENSDE